MIYRWINDGRKSDTHTLNPDHVSRLDIFIIEQALVQDAEGRYIINDEIRETLLTADDEVIDVVL